MASSPVNANISQGKKWDIIASQQEANNIALDIQTVIEQAVCFRDRGLPHKSVSLLQALPTFVLDNIVIQNEFALSYILQHNFAKVLKLMSSVDSVHSNNIRDHGFAQMLLHYASIHTDLMLAEAVESSERVYQRWLAERKIEDYDRLDVSAK